MKPSKFYIWQVYLLQDICPYKSTTCYQIMAKVIISFELSYYSFDKLIIINNYIINYKLFIINTFIIIYLLFDYKL